MNPSFEQTQADLAFLRGLVEPGSGFQRTFGTIYLAAGLTYGAQMVLHLAQALTAFGAAYPWTLLIGLGPTIVFLAVLTLIISFAIATDSGPPSPHGQSESSSVRRAWPISPSSR
ncbi:MAG: hypothetical protein ACRED9_07110 [Caulobacteraceae bacterium]